LLSAIRYWPAQCDSRARAILGELREVEVVLKDRNKRREEKAFRIRLRGNAR